MTPSTQRRRQRIADALQSAVKGETITLDELALIWGVGKPAFVNLRNVIADFPNQMVDGKKYFYPRIDALESLDRYERRGDEVAAGKSDRIKALLGASHEDGTAPSISEMAKANQLRQDVEARMISQGELLLKSDVQRMLSRIFEVISRPLSSLGTIVDPNGQYETEIRDALDKAGADLLLQLHGMLADKLAPNVTPDQPVRARAHRKQTGRVGTPGSPRDGRGGSPKPARSAKAADRGVDKPLVGRAPRNQGAKRTKN